MPVQVAAPAVEECLQPLEAGHVEQQADDPLCSSHYGQVLASRLVKVARYSHRGEGARPVRATTGRAGACKRSASGSWRSDSWRILALGTCYPLQGKYRCVCAPRLLQSSIVCACAMETGSVRVAWSWRTSLAAALVSFHGHSVAARYPGRNVAPMVRLCCNFLAGASVRKSHAQSHSIERLDALEVCQHSPSS